METERHEVLGVEFDVNKERVGSWRMFQLFQAAQKSVDDFDKIDAVMSIACYITDMTADEFIEKCGGEDAPLTKVLEIASTLISEAYPKN